MRKWMCVLTLAACFPAVAGCDWLAAWFPPEAVTLDEAAGGGTVSLAGGQALFVRLEANPSTGFNWEIEALDEAVLELLGTAYEEAAPGLPGSGGTAVFRFVARGPGRTPLRLVYRRAWEDAPPEETFAVDVVVR